MRLPTGSSAHLRRSRSPSARRPRARPYTSWSSRGRFRSSFPCSCLLPYGYKNLSLSVADVSGRTGDAWGKSTTATKEGVRGSSGRGGPPAGVVGGHHHVVTLIYRGPLEGPSKALRVAFQSLSSSRLVGATGTRRPPPQPPTSTRTKRRSGTCAAARTPGSRAGARGRSAARGAAG